MVDIESTQAYIARSLEEELRVLDDDTEKTRAIRTKVLDKLEKAVDSVPDTPSEDPEKFAQHMQILEKAVATADSIDTAAHRRVSAKAKYAVVKDVADISKAVAALLKEGTSTVPPVEVSPEQLEADFDEAVRKAEIVITNEEMRLDPNDLGVD